MPDKENRRELVFLAGGDSRSRRDVRQEMNELGMMKTGLYILEMVDGVHL